MIKELDYPSYSSGGFQRISWGAVFAGAIVSLGVLVLLTSLGAGIGLAAAPSAMGGAAAGGGSTALGVGIGAGIWMLLTGIISFYAGGWIAGRLTGIARVSESVIHGIVCWATATVMLAFVFTTATVGALGAASNAVGSTLGRPDAAAAETRAVTPGDAQTASRAAGAAGLFGFVMLLCDGLAAGYGARAGTRVLKPVPMSEVRRERAGV